MTRTSQEPARPPVRLEMSIAADWDRIDPVREAVERLVGVASRCPDASSALAMVSAELLENAVKYGKPGKGSVSYVLEERAAEIVIVVTNEAAPGRSLVELDERLAWIRGFADPADAYMAAMTEIFARADEACEGGLGLVRIAHEGGCRISRDDGNPCRVTMRATYPIPPGAQP